MWSRRMAGRWEIIAIAALVSLTGCADPGPPRLVVVPDKAQLDGHVGAYWGGTVYLAPGATWEVLQHELDHHYWGSLGETSQ